MSRTFSVAELIDLRTSIHDLWNGSSVSDELGAKFLEVMTFIEETAAATPVKTREDAVKLAVFAASESQLALDREYQFDSMLLTMLGNLASALERGV